MRLAGLVVLPTQQDTSKRRPGQILDCPLGPDYRRDVRGIRAMRVDPVLVGRMLAFRAVITVAERQDDWLGQVVVKVDGERVGALAAVPQPAPDTTRTASGQATPRRPIGAVWQNLLAASALPAPVATWRRWTYDEPSEITRRR
jgi:hypothetical protein